MSVFDPLCIRQSPIPDQEPLLIRFLMGMLLMLQRELRLSVFSVFAILLLIPLTAPALVAATAAGAAETEKPADTEGLNLLKDGTRPLISVTFASADRFVDEARYIFEAAEMPDGFKVVEKWLESTMNNLDGFNRKKPFGLMVYLPAIFPPTPEIVAFVPVDSIDDAQKLIEKAPVVLKKDAKLPDRYEIIGPNQTVPMLIRDGYAFFPFGRNPDPAVLDRDIPNPAQLVASQARQFDVAVTLDIASIPAGTRILLTNVITSGISTQLQQRDDEPDGAYQMRRIEGERVLASLKQLLDECERIILGVDVVQNEHAVNMDVVIEAAPGSKMMEEILSSSSKPSYFIPLLDDSAAVSLSSSSILNERDRKAFSEILDGLRTELFRQIEERSLGPIPDENGPISHAITAIQTTLQQGHVDMFAQFYQDSSDKLAIVGALRIDDGDTIAAGIMDALSRLQSSDDFTKFGTITIASDQHLGMTFHRVVFSKQPEEAVEIFGRDIGVTLGCGGRTLWLCLGGTDSFSALTKVRNQFEEALQKPQDRTSPSSMRMVLNVNQLVEMQQRAMGVRRSREAADQSRQADETRTLESSPADDPKTSPLQVNDENSASPEQRRPSRENRFAARRRQAGKIARDTLAEGDDRIEIDVRPTDTGGRVRVRLEEGFVKILGRLLATRFAGESPQPEENQ
jgi:hypothetical protein